MEHAEFAVASRRLTVHVCYRHRPQWRWLIPGICPLCGAELEPVDYIPATWLEPESLEPEAADSDEASARLYELRRDLAVFTREMLALNSRAAVAESEREVAEGVIEDLTDRLEGLRDELEDCRLAALIAERRARGQEAISLEDFI